MKTFEAAGRIHGDEIIACRPHRRVDGVARAERLAAALEARWPQVSALERSW